MQRYYVIKLSKKDNKPKLILSDMIPITKDVIQSLEALKEYNISTIKQVDYYIGDAIKDGTITHTEKFNNDVHVTVVKYDKEHTIVLPISTLKKSYSYNVHAAAKIIDTIKSDKLTKDFYLSTDKEVKNLKLDDGVILIKKKDKHG